MQDTFADIRVRVVVDALPLFRRLTEDGSSLARPMHEVLGTFLFFLMILFGMAASSSPSNAFERLPRIYVSFFALIFLSGWSL